jgi:hypothetical protein
VPADEILWSRWDDVDAMLARALDLPAAERAGWVRGAAPGDEQLVALVLRLLDRVGDDPGRAGSPSASLVAGGI